MEFCKTIILIIGLISTSKGIVSADPTGSLESPVKIFSQLNIIDVQNGSISNNNYLVIQNDMIRFKGKSLPAEFNPESAIDMQGLFVIPGLIDTHAHISLGEVTFKKKRGKLAINAHSSDEISQWNARELLRWGVTYIRNPGGSTEHNVRYREQVATGNLQGPGAKVAGEIINNTAFDGLALNINKKLSLEQAIKQQKEAGVDIIKLYTGLSKEQIKQAIKLGHQMDLQVIAHLEDVSWTDAASWNIDGIVHGFPGSPSLLDTQAKKEFETTSRPGSFAFFEWYEKVDLNSKPMTELYQALRNNNVHIDPTLIAFRNAFYGDNKSVIEHPDLHHVNPELLHNWRTFFTFNLGWKEQDYDRARKVWPKVLRFVKRLYDEGISLTVGTDLGNPWVIPGLSVHQEMQIFANAGIPNKDILKMATIDAASHLGIAKTHGSIEPGKIANLVFLRKNPLNNIANTKTITKVYLAGKLVQLTETKIAVNLHLK